MASSQEQKEMSACVPSCLFVPSSIYPSYIVQVHPHPAQWLINEIALWILYRYYLNLEKNNWSLKDNIGNFQTDTLGDKECVLILHPSPSPLWFQLLSQNNCVRRHCQFGIELVPGFLLQLKGLCYFCVAAALSVLSCLWKEGLAPESLWRPLWLSLIIMQFVTTVRRIAKANCLPTSQVPQSSFKTVWKCTIASLDDV